MLIFTGCGVQTVSAHIGTESEGATVIINVTDGWSVDFASDCFSVYDEEITETSAGIAICTAVEKEIFDDYVKEAEASDTYEKLNNAIYYESTDGATYLLEGNGAHFILVEKDKKKGDEILEKMRIVEAD